MLPSPPEGHTTFLPQSSTQKPVLWWITEAWCFSHRGSMHLRSVRLSRCLPTGGREHRGVFKEESGKVQLSSRTKVGKLRRGGLRPPRQQEGNVAGESVEVALPILSLLHQSKVDYHSRDCYALAPWISQDAQRWMKLHSDSSQNGARQNHAASQKSNPNGHFGQVSRAQAPQKSSNRVWTRYFFPSGRTRAADRPV